MASRRLSTVDIYCQYTHYTVPSFVCFEFDQYMPVVGDRINLALMRLFGQHSD